MQCQSHVGVEDFSSWVVQASGRLRSVRGLRLRLLSSLVGIPALLPLGQVDRQIRAPGSYIANDPMPPSLAAWVEAAARRVHVPDRRALHGETIYLLPPWLLRVRPRSEGIPSNGIRIRLSRSERLSFTVEDPITTGMPVPHSLRTVLLLTQERSKTRRIGLWESAIGLIGKFEKAVGRSHVSGWEWLQQMIQDPVDAENHALEVWNAAITDLDVPESFQFKKRIYSLWDHLVIHQGPEPRAHWRSFVGQQPWAARRLLDVRNPRPAFDRLEDSPLGIIRTAASVLCCRRGEYSCTNALEFAGSLASYREVWELDRILGGDRSHDISSRALLMEAHTQGGGEILPEICKDIPLSRRQVRRAGESFHALTTGLSSNGSAAHAFAALLVRMMVRDRFDPEHLEPGAVANGLISVSADCLACFIAGRVSDPLVDLPEELLGCDSIDIGLLALAKGLGDYGTRSLTTEQLIRFATRAREVGEHRLEIVKRRGEKKWPPPPGVPECNDFRHDGFRILALSRSQCLDASGLQAAGCPSGSHYADAATLGRLIPFALNRDQDQHATLILKPVQERRGRRIAVLRWETSELFGPGNARPVRICEEVAEAFRRFLNEPVPQLRAGVGNSAKTADTEGNR